MSPVEHVLVVVTMSLAIPAAQATPRPACVMRPPRASFLLPNRGLTWYRGEEFKGRCARVPPEQWVRKPGKDLDLFVRADGPSGSGRYWEITVAVGGKKRAAPTRGFCLMGSTVGWRTLQAFEGGLHWVDDGDGDSRPELVFWDSFPLAPEPSGAEWGLTAWVYELDGNQSLVLDLGLSRGIARKLAEAYRRPLETSSEPLRRPASDALAAFADDTCDVETEGAR